MTSALPILPAGPASAACCAPAVGLDQALDAERIAAIAKALGEPLRVRLLDVLRRSEDPVCQCELVALFEIKQSLLAHHMKKLTEPGLVDRRASPQVGLLLDRPRHPPGADRMAELTTTPSPASCCSTETQAACCEPSEKDDCCGTAAAGGACGCAAGEQVPAPPADIREAVREKYAAAARAAAAGTAGACCGPATADASGDEVFGGALYTREDAGTPPRRR